MTRPTIACPCCGARFEQVASQASGSRAQELLRLMAKSIAAKSGARESNWGREVYRGQGTRAWFLTYSGELPPYPPFTDEDIGALLKQDVIEETYRGCSDVYSLSAKGRAAVGLPVDLPPRGAPRNLAARHEEWRRRRDAGERVADIAKSAGVSIQTVYAAIRAPKAGGA